MDLNYVPPGAVAEAFFFDRSPFAGIMGPMGSAKTSTCIMKMARIASETPVSKITGERMCKFGIVRNTFADLKRTTMKSIEQWFQSAGHWGGGGSSSEPPYFKVGFRLPDGTIARLWMDFVGLDTHSVEQLAKGWELSWYWMNEMDLMPREVKDMLDGRVGRYPGAAHYRDGLYGGFGDYNAPDIENWAYKLFEEEKPEGHKLFKQPSGLSAKAENVQNLPAGYYDRMMVGKQDWWIRRNIKNMYGFSREGKPVYLDEYNDDIHCTSVPIVPVKDIVIKADFDQGLHPAVVLRQPMPNGQVRILDELYADKGARSLCEALTKLIGSAKYAGCRVVGGKCDPAGEARDTIEAESWIDAINRLMNWTGSAQLTAAPTNAPDKCQDAVRDRLTTMVDGGIPGLLISSSCLKLRKGFNSHFRFKKQKAGGFSDAPEKNFPYADVHNALQYGSLDDGGYEAIVGREGRKARAMGSRPRQAKVEVRLG